jgi:hypothetical protein
VEIGRQLLWLLLVILGCWRLAIELTVVFPLPIEHKKRVPLLIDGGHVAQGCTDGSIVKVLHDVLMVVQL